MWQAGQSDLAFSAAREGLCLSAYLDTAPELPPEYALGFGLHKPGVTATTDTTLEEAVADFVAAAPIYEADVNDVFGDVPLLQHQGGALFSAAYNCGGTTLRNSTSLIAAIKTFLKAPKPLPTASADEKNAWQDLRDAAGHQFQFIKPAHKPTLFHNLSRRSMEEALFLSGNYGDLRFVPFWPKGTSPKAIPPDRYYRIEMPTFRGSP